MSDSSPDLSTGGTPYAMPVPSILLIGVVEETAALLRGSIPALQIRAKDAADAKWRIPVARPLVIATGSPLAGDEARELRELANAVGAAIVALDTCLLPSDVVERVLRAWRAAGAKRAGG